MASPQKLSDQKISGPISGPAIGTSVVRSAARRLVAGKGHYTADIPQHRLLHLCFLRSPFARAKILSIDIDAAGKMPGVVAVLVGKDIAEVCTPMQTRNAAVPDHFSPPQYPLAIDQAVWQGEAIVAIAASTRAAAEDAAEHVSVEWDEGDALVTPQSALESGAKPIHPELESNLAVERKMGAEDAEKRSDAAEVTVEHNFVFDRQTGVSLEARSIVASYDRSDDTLMVWQSHQTPHQMQDVFARHLDIPEHKVRVICGDVGGGFGTKLHAYPDELAVCAVSKLLGRPVSFVADRLEAFVSDAHAREFTISAKMGANANGTISGMSTDILMGTGAYSIYPRASIGDAMLAAALCGAPYKVKASGVRARVAYQNKALTGSYRGVGQPISAAVTEQLIDFAAWELGIDPLDFRRRAFHDPDAYPLTTVGGVQVEHLSQHACLEKLAIDMDYEELRAEQSALRKEGVYRGIGVAAFVEQTAPGAGLYGPAEVRVSAQDAATVKFEPSGTVRVEVGCTDQGQGTLTGIAQIVADELGVPVDNVSVHSGDTNGPYGGGAWASRGLTIGGEASVLAAREVRDRLLAVAAALLQADPSDLSLGGFAVRDQSGAARLSITEVLEAAHFRQHLLPPDTETELTATRHFLPRTVPYYTANGIQASYLEIDLETGFIKLLGHWAVEDCGRIINPQLVDEQIRGGIVQGLGAVLYEHCMYDSEGQLTNGTMADYLLPMASEMPDIHVGHVETPQQGTILGVKGAGEAGVIGATASVWCAANDALRPTGARLTHQPFTPERVLDAVARQS